MNASVLSVVSAVVIVTVAGCPATHEPATPRSVAVTIGEVGERAPPSAGTEVESSGDAALPPLEQALGPQQEMIYELARWDRYLFVSAQGGAAVWDVRRARPVAARPASICTNAVRVHEAFWAGCDAQVLRWTPSEGWRSYLRDGDGSDDADRYELLVAPNGELRVGYGPREHRYLPNADRFEEVAATFAGAYDARAFGGELWSIRFMSGVQGPQGFFPIGGPVYPGRDPRRLRVDGSGRLWVEDFGAGFYRWDGQRFVDDGIVGEKGTGVAHDPSRDRLWLLHYTQGLTLVEGGQVTGRIDLSDLTYMRDLLLDADGSVWVAGWPGLVRVRWEGGEPLREDFASRPRG